MSACYIHMCVCEMGFVAGRSPEVRTVALQSAGRVKSSVAHVEFCGVGFVVKS